MAFVNGRQGSLQIRERLLRAGEIAGLQGAGQALIGRIRLVVPAKELLGGGR